MRFQAIFFVLFALATSFLSLFAVVSAEDSPASSNVTTLAPTDTTVITAQPPSAPDTNNAPPANETVSSPEANNNSNNNTAVNTAPSTVAVPAPTPDLTTAPSSVTSSNDTVNQTESRNTTESPPQNLVSLPNTTAAPATTTQSPGGVSEACLQGWRNHSIDDFCQRKTNESVANCEEKELVILQKHGCWVLQVVNSTGQNVSKDCLRRITECLSNTDLSSEEIKTNFCRQDKSPSDCFTKGDNSSSACSADDYQAFRKASDCSSSRRVAEACTLIVLLASVVALALTSE